MQVIFRNEVTQEYLFYVVTFKAIPCGPLGAIELSTAVRQSASSSLKVENPLQYPVAFSTDCKVPDISLPPQIVVPAQSEVGLGLGITWGEREQQLGTGA